MEGIKIIFFSSFSLSSQLFLVWDTNCDTNWDNWDIFLDMNVDNLYTTHYTPAKSSPSVAQYTVKDTLEILYSLISFFKTD